jgi:hypothetical protein
VPEEILLAFVASVVADVASPVIREDGIDPAVRVPTPVMPVYDPEIRADATVPLDRFEAFNEIKFAPDTAPNEPDHVPAVIVPTLVNDEDTTLEASVVPVSEEAATAGEDTHWVL